MLQATDPVLAKAIAKAFLSAIAATAPNKEFGDAVMLVTSLEIALIPNRELRLSIIELLEDLKFEKLAEDTGKAVSLLNAENTNG